MCRYASIRNLFSGFLKPGRRRQGLKWRLIKKIHDTVNSMIQKENDSAYTFKNQPFQELLCRFLELFFALPWPCRADEASRKIKLYLVFMAGCVVR